MQCQQCNERPATLHFTQVIHGEKTEIHVCEVCAKEKGYMVFPEEGYTLQNLLSGLFNYKQNSLTNQHASVLKKYENLECPKCHMTFSTFQRTGKFGCGTCYDTFSARLKPVFRRVHSGNTKHYGKIPKRQGGHLHLKKQIDTLQKELQSLIEAEAFEEAAKIRDQIRSLKEEVKDWEEKAGGES